MTDADTPSRAEILQGTLEMLTLKALTLQPMHGWGISIRLRQISGEVFDVNQGSLYPPPHGRRRRAWIRAYSPARGTTGGAATTETTGDARRNPEARWPEGDTGPAAWIRVLGSRIKGA